MFQLVPVATQRLEEAVGEWAHSGLAPTAEQQVQQQIKEVQDARDAATAAVRSFASMQESSLVQPWRKDAVRRTASAMLDSIDRLMSICNEIATMLVMPNTGRPGKLGALNKDVGHQLRSIEDHIKHHIKYTECQVVFSTASSLGAKDMMEPRSKDDKDETPASEDERNPIFRMVSQIMQTLLSLHQHGLGLCYCGCRFRAKPVVPCAVATVVTDAVATGLLLQVILDESCQMSEPDAYIALSKGTRWGLLVGDPQQLRPCVKSGSAKQSW